MPAQRRWTRQDHQHYIGSPGDPARRHRWLRRSKSALRNLTRTLALELAPDHINVNNIAPGTVLTPFNQSAIDDLKVREEQVQSIPWRRPAEPWEIARLAVYRASDEADYAQAKPSRLIVGSA